VENQRGPVGAPEEREGKEKMNIKSLLERMGNMEPGDTMRITSEEIDFVKEYGLAFKLVAKLDKEKEELKGDGTFKYVLAMREFVARQEAHGLVVDSLPVDSLQYNPNVESNHLPGCPCNWCNVPEDVLAPKLDRMQEWDRFSNQVRRHVEEYTIAQYDNPDGNGQIEEMDAGECITHIKGYITRFGKGVRGPQEELRDLLKIAHWASFAYSKRARELGVPELYSRKLSTQEMFGELMKKREGKSK